MVLDLNIMMIDKELHFWNDAFGDIILPSDIRKDGIEDELQMPLKYRNLYSNYRQYNNRLFVVSYDNKPYMAMSFLLDDCWLEDICKDGITPASHKRLWLAIQDYANLIHYDLYSQYGCSIAIGKDTDVEGHELMIMIPYDYRDKIAEIVARYDSEVYIQIQELF